MVESITLTVLTTSTAVFDAESVTLYVTVKGPSELVSITLPTATILSVITPSRSSSAVAPASVYVSPSSITTVASPTSVFTGAISSTVTVLTTSIAALPAASDTLYVIEKTPAVLVSTESAPAVIIELVK